MLIENAATCCERIAGGWTLDLDLRDQLNNLFNVTKHTLTNRTQTVHAPVPPLPHLPQYWTVIGRAVTCWSLIGPAAAHPCTAHPNNGLLAYWMSAPNNCQFSLLSDYQKESGVCSLLHPWQLLTYNTWINPVLRANIYVKTSTFQTEIKTKVASVDWVFHSFCVQTYCSNIPASLEQHFSL